MTPGAPQSATDHDDRTTAAVKSVLVEFGQILGAFKGRFAVIGGAVPWLLREDEDMPHVGTLDVDLSLDAEAPGDGEYATLVAALQEHGYRQRERLRRFQLARTIQPRDGGPALAIVVDFLMPPAQRHPDRPPVRDAHEVLSDGGAVLLIQAPQPVAHDFASRPGPVEHDGDRRPRLGTAEGEAMSDMVADLLWIWSDDREIVPADRRNARDFAPPSRLRHGEADVDLGVTFSKSLLSLRWPVNAPRGGHWQ